MSCDDIGILIYIADNIQRQLYLFGARLIGSCQQYAVGVKNLVLVKLTEILSVHLAFCAVHNGYAGIYAYIVVLGIIDCRDNVRQLAHAGGLNNDSVGLIGFDRFLERLGEIAHQATADTAGVHLGNLDAALLQKSAVHTYLTELVLDKHQLLALEHIADKSLYKSCFSRTQKAGNYINLCHFTFLFS